MIKKSLSVKPKGSINLYFRNQHIYNMLLEYLAIFQGDNNFPEGKN